MKKIIFIFSIVAVATAFLVAACNSKSKTTDAKPPYADTVGLAAFQQWKAQNELRDLQVYYSQGRESAPVATHARTTHSTSRKATSRKAATAHRAVSRSSGSMSS